MWRHPLWWRGPQEKLRACGAIARVSQRAMAGLRRHVSKPRHLAGPAVGSSHAQRLQGQGHLPPPRGSLHACDAEAITSALTAHAQELSAPCVAVITSVNCIVGLTCLKGSDA